MICEYSFSDSFCSFSSIRLNYKNRGMGGTVSFVFSKMERGQTIDFSFSNQYLATLNEYPV